MKTHGWLAGTDAEREKWRSSESKKIVISAIHLCLIVDYSSPMVLRCTALIGQLENIYFYVC